MWSTIGHERAVEVFRRSLADGRLAHAYLIVGRPHIGKMTLALNLAQALNCTGEPPPCGECSACRRIVSNRHPDVQVVAVDSEANLKEGRARKEISTDAVKAMVHAASLPPFEGRHKVFIINDAELLSGEAANRLLKTLEEPPPRVLFVLLSARESWLLPTIVSRCLRLELQPVPSSRIAAMLATQGVDAARAATAARVSKGCPGWAVSLAGDDRLWQERLDLHAGLNTVLGGGIEERFAFAGELAGRLERDRAGALDVLEIWLDWWRDLMLVKAGLSGDVVNLDLVAVFQQWAGELTMVQIARCVRRLTDVQEQLRLNASPRLALEVLMLGLPDVPRLSLRAHPFGKLRAGSSAEGGRSNPRPVLSPLAGGS